MSEIMSEIRKTNSPRVEILLLTNFAESIFKDFFEFELETEEARDIPRHYMMKIIKDRHWLSDDLAHDVEVIFSIRDTYAHWLSLDEANKRVETELLPKIKYVKTKPNQFLYNDRLSLLEKIVLVSDFVTANLITEFDGFTKQPLRVRVLKSETDASCPDKKQV